MPDQSVLAQRKDPDLYPEVTWVGRSFGSIQTFREWTFGRYVPLRQPQPADLPEDSLLPDSRNLALVLNQIEYTGEKRFDDHRRRWCASRSRSSDCIPTRSLCSPTCSSKPPTACSLSSRPVRMRWCRRSPINRTLSLRASDREPGPTATSRSREARVLARGLPSRRPVADGRAGCESVSGVAIYMEGGGNKGNGRAALRQGMEALIAPFGLHCAMDRRAAGRC